ncbi:MAG: poly(3-hydroxybutyrate) depolymerase [Hyphomicrobium sp.]|nr:MAG: poly(3-hydroxybutyrate) depolymerase [Hyphomicrobium sp.]MBZ0209584.1 poly(3-hydroxybutyrate) depolymerase [Hyphomicrobium sp.]
MALAATLGGCSEQPAADLPALEAQRDATSVSGISSGAYMAGQFEMAHAKDVVGAAIIAGGPYGCSESLYADVIPGPGTALLNLTKAINGCMLNALQAFGVPNPALLAERAERLAEHNRIDPIADVKADRIYLFTGKNDTTVVPAIVDAARKFYEDIGVPASQILYVSDIPAGHAFVTADRGPECDHTGKPYIVDCNYDQAGALLGQIYGSLSAPAEQMTGQFQVFDQDAFTEGLSNHGLSDDGLVYVPQACQTNAGCRVHIAFHGCGQNRTFVGDAFARDSGYARWADTNNLIVLFPQTAATPLNPQGCWDWWGYTGPDYLTRDAPQITAVYRMLERLSAPRTSS